jgi:hypothetical protein
MRSKLKRWWDHWVTVVTVGVIFPFVVMGLFGLVLVGLRELREFSGGKLDLSDKVAFLVLAFFGARWTHQRLQSMEKPE